MPAETPWTDPRVGDTCEPAAGKKRTVLQVRYAGYAGGFHQSTVRATGDWVDGIVYEAGSATKTCAATTWATWCRQAMAQGGQYARGGKVWRVGDPLFEEVRA